MPPHTAQASNLKLERSFEREQEDTNDAHRATEKPLKNRPQFVREPTDTFDKDISYRHTISRSDFSFYQSVPLYDKLASCEFRGILFIREQRDSFVFFLSFVGGQSVSKYHMHGKCDFQHKSFNSKNTKITRSRQMVRYPFA